MARRLIVSGFVFGVDDETFSDEYGSTNFFRETILSPSLPQNVIEMKYGWGGECRIEISLLANIFSNQDILVRGTVKLFEGTSEYSNDLDGQRDFVLLVPRNQVVSYTGRVDNDDEGGDYANYTLTFQNIFSS